MDPDLPPVELPLEKITTHIAEDLLKTPDISCLKKLHELFGPPSYQDREAVLVELLADICVVAAGAGVNAAALSWLLPELYSHIIHNADEETFSFTISGGTGIASTHPPAERLSHLQAKTLMKYATIKGCPRISLRHMLSPLHVVQASQRVQFSSAP